MFHDDPLAGDPRQVTRLLGIFSPRRLQAYGFAIAVVYAAVLLRLYNEGVWLVDRIGKPIYTEFACQWIAGVLALHGRAALVYDPIEFLKFQQRLVGPQAIYGIWPYPPTYFLFFIPFSFLPYPAAFLAWNLISLGVLAAIVYIIARRSVAIPLVLASPFTAWDFLAGHNAFLTAALYGASLRLLEHRPMVAGFLVGCLSYKPHLATLFPIALAASRQWRAFGAAAVTAILLAAASIVTFGIDVWRALPRQLIWFASETLARNGAVNSTNDWGKLQTLYGLVRYLNGGGVFAWLAQGLTTLGVGLLVWKVWNSRAPYQLKAAILSAAALLATPYAFATDMAALAIPVAFLVSDQIRSGLLRGEQAIILSLICMSFAILLTLGRVPLGPIVIVVLLGVIVRRIFRHTNLRSSSGDAVIRRIRTGYAGIDDTATAAE